MRKFTSSVSFWENLTKSLESKQHESLDFSELKLYGRKPLKHIESYALCDCKAVEEIVLPKKLESIGEGAFCGCENLKKIDIPESVVKIGKAAFENCRSLEKITLPKSIYSLRANIFNGCASLSEIEIPSGVLLIDGNAFKDCTSLKKVSLPETLMQIEIWAFENCKSLESIVIPQNVREIYPGAFKNCTSLKKVVCYDSTKIDNGAFQGCGEDLQIEKISSRETFKISVSDKLKSSETDALETLRDSLNEEFPGWEIFDSGSDSNLDEEFSELRNECESKNEWAIFEIIKNTQLENAPWICVTIVNGEKERVYRNPISFFYEIGRVAMAAEEIGASEDEKKELDNDAALLSTLFGDARSIKMLTDTQEHLREVLDCPEGLSGETYNAGLAIFDLASSIIDLPLSEEVKDLFPDGYGNLTVLYENDLLPNLIDSCSFIIELPGWKKLG